MGRAGSETTQNSAEKQDVLPTPAVKSAVNAKNLPPDLAELAKTWHALSPEMRDVLLALAKASCVPKQDG